MTNLLGKKILLVCPPFMGYDKHIYEKINLLGGDVLQIQSKKYYKTLNWIGKTHFTKKLFAKLEKKIIKNYNKNLIDIISKNRFDYVLIIKGDLLLEDTVRYLKDQNFNGKLVLYLWDSLKSFNPGKILNYFEKVYSFDRIDCENNKHLNYLPLFYLDDYLKIGNEPSVEIKYDLFFIGGNHVINQSTRKYGIKHLFKAYILNDEYIRREDFLKRICKNIGRPDLTFCFYIIDNIVNFKPRKLINSKKGFNYFFRPIPINKFINEFRKSRVIIDINHPWQSGLTIRTFESLAAKKKLITTNKNIAQEPFYIKENILIINFEEESFNVPIDFIRSPFIQMDLKNYSLESFIIKLFSQQ